MVIDYTHPGQSIRAQRVLWEVGIAAVLTPYKLLDRGEVDAAATVFVVHRVEVPEADVPRAVSELVACGLLALETE